MTDDPFENFGEQMRSFELLDEHRSALLDEATRERLRALGYER